MLGLRMHTIEEATKNIIILAKISGLYISTNYWFLQEGFLFLNGLISTCLLFNTLPYYWGNIDKISVVLYYFIMGGDICFSPLMGYFMKNNIHKTVQETFWTYDYKSATMMKKQIEMEEIREKLIRKLHKLMIFGISYMLLDVTLLAIVESKINQDILLLFPCWLPLDINSNTHLHVALLGWEIILVGIECFMMFCGLAFFYLFYWHVRSELIILRFAMENLEVRAREMVEEFNEGYGAKEKFDKCCIKCLNMCVEHHIRIIKFFNDTRNITKIFYSLSYLGAGIAFTFAGFFIISDHYVVKIKFIGISLAQLLFLYLISWIAEKIEDEGFLVCDTTYNMEWYSLPRECQTTLLVMRTVSSRPLESKLLTGHKVSLKLLCDLVNASYSYLNVLLVISRRDVKNSL